MSGRQSLRGKRVLITGAARGIGAEAARQLAARGARVILVGLEPELLAAVAAECGPEARSFECDVTDAASVEAAVAGASRAHGGIDVVVANAGIGVGGLVQAIDPAAFERVIDVNLLGVWRTVRAALPHLIEARGYVLPIASLAAIAPSFPGMSAYSASKAGVEAFTRALAVEVGHLGVDVGVAYFGWIDTDLVAGGDENPAFRELRQGLPGPLRKTYPVSDAGRAIARGIERRSRVVAAPRWVRAALLLRGFAAPVGEREMRRQVPEVAAAFGSEFESSGVDASAAPRSRRGG